MMYMYVQTNPPSQECIRTMKTIAYTVKVQVEVNHVYQIVEYLYSYH